MKRDRLYWTLQFSGWGAYGFVSMIAGIALVPMGSYMVLSTTITVLLGIITSHVYRKLIKKWDWLRLKLGHLLWKSLLASTTLGVILVILSVSANIATFIWLGVSYRDGVPEAIQKAELNFFLKPNLALVIVFNYSILYLLWSAIYFTYHFIRKNREAEIEKWKLQASIKDAELGALKSQINPHFIFNSLNNIRSLVIEDSEKARDMITYLSDLLRYSIQFDQYEKVSLEKEIEIVKEYLNLESIQLEERLRYRFNIDPHSLEIKLPPMIIQTLVENAIKHSINELPNGGEILVESKLNTRFLKIYVKNTGQLKTNSSNKRRGIGIKNSKERLRLLYGENAGLSVENMNESMVCATVKIPLEKKNLSRFIIGYFLWCCLSIISTGVCIVLNIDT